MNPLSRGWPNFLRLESLVIDGGRLDLPTLEVTEISNIGKSVTDFKETLSKLIKVFSWIVGFRNQRDKL